MSDTPRTDAAQSESYLPPANYVVAASVARELERENNQLRALLGASLQDTKRIDWLAEQYRRERKSYSEASVAAGDNAWPEDEVTLIVHCDDGMIRPVDGATFRVTIDTAQKICTT